jgi:hypothetical protein
MGQKSMSDSNSLPGYAHGFARSELELRRIHALGQGGFGELAADYGRHVDLARAYPYGFSYLSLDSRIVGAFGIWPVSERWAQALLEGRAGEADCDAERDILDPSSDPVRTWYWDSLVVEPDLCGSGASRFLIREALLAWYWSGPGFPSRILAQAATDRGQIVLERLGFERVLERTADGVSLYQFCFDSKQIAGDTIRAWAQGWLADAGLPRQYALPD